ncbi:hypothetical protein BKH41_09280 [Helicobacter sp. 12S02232-10]|uniref:ArnT family glycosyltransferase n=1 Tax=Helicobacter sp. 12S02232-10 TaxID=1476197 RepID=UPI000BA6A63C|nr:glycosyltransferase family 39 protein [Helicobacter sp. 12S02232-10]PAF46340.1 hypothetical protein BKH41_09280 [Helicobacter sp. 12S02232-10]
MFWKDRYIYFLMFIVFCVFAYMNYRFLDIQFLGATGGDELPQFHQWLNMYEGFKHFNIEKIFRFEFYNYGFVWYLLNLVVIAPFHLMHNTEMAIYMPRLLNGFFSVLCLWMVYKICRLYLSALYAYGVVLLIILMSGFWAMGYMVKPDVLQAFFILWSVFLLALDKFRFGKMYYGAIFVFGLAVGAAKFQAVMFFPVLYAYIFIPYLRDKTTFSFKKMLLHCVGVSVATMFLWLVLNPYLFHPRGMRAWWDMFVFNMESNATNHGSYIHVSLRDKIFNVIDFYYFEIIVFVILLCICFALLWWFFSKKSHQDGAKIYKWDFFVVLNVGFLISLFYLLFAVNKAWSIYYLSTIYLGVLLFIPMLTSLKYFQYILIPLLVLQIFGGMGVNQGYEVVFKKYDKDLSGLYAQSAELVKILEPIVKKSDLQKQKIEILSDLPSFEYKKLGLRSTNIHQIFAQLTPDMFSSEIFLQKSNSKNLAYFISPDLIILSKNKWHFFKNPSDLKDKNALESLKTIEALNRGEYGYQKVAESKNFIIYAKSLKKVSNIQKEK